MLRLSGPRAHDIGRAMVSRWPSHPRQAVVGEVRDSSGATLDQVVVVRYDAPASFTGEDSIEISTHGGLVVPTTVVAAALAHGARLAQPGEFTRRALLNGKLDILQAEATADLIAAGSRAAQRIALQQLDGGLSRRIAALRDQVIGIARSRRNVPSPRSSSWRAGCERCSPLLVAASSFVKGHSSCSPERLTSGSRHCSMRSSAEAVRS